jgi:hypothetical protein
MTKRRKRNLAIAFGCFITLRPGIQETKKSFDGGLFRTDDGNGYCKTSALDGLTAGYGNHELTKKERPKTWRGLLFDDVVFVR